MCKECDKAAIDMNVREDDLPYMKYTPVFWECAVPGCTNGTRMKDYGMMPLYLWNVKRSANRGGWIDATVHWLLCGKHWNKGKGQFLEGRVIHVEMAKNPSYLLERIKNKKGGESLFVKT